MTTRKPSPDELRVLALFGGFSDEVLAQFAEIAEPIMLDAGDTVYEEGEPARALFVVGEGVLDVLKRCASRDAERHLIELSPGDFFGEMSFVDMQPRSATVRAASDVLLWSWPYPVLSELYRQDGKAYTLLVMNIARELSRRLRRADRMLVGHDPAAE